MGFNKIISQENAIRMLKGTLRTKKIPYALIFLGDAYIGKTSTAIAYAKALNCINTENEDSCDNCESCKKIDQGIHADIKIVSPEKDIITVTMIREIEEFVSLKVLEGRYKVIIIKEAHKMNNAAANAFLKTIEEPPLKTVIILICENIYALPEPLISRCFKIYFKPLPIEAVKKIIPNVENESVFRIAMGKPGLFISRNILKDIQWFAFTLNSLKESNKKSIWKDNEEIRLWLDILCIFLRDSIVKLINRVSSDYCMISHLDFKLKENISLREIFDLYEEIQKIKKNLDLNLNKSILANYLVSCINDLITIDSEKQENFNLQTLKEIFNE